ncbi:Sensor histidine kinase regB [Oligella ureolytica]|uniref:histidine kinase n=2 Tax=Oligella ureolytica TaxID=90244 RepID=A0A378XGS7_9BURK|nr:ATP-binding protein [Oligella ureolytica]SUA54066.1 Sensor histidine kinase regB [Oligella ureolytica]SUA55190.1 Sensor histidine kinase regB [Oligella ureolytica]
MTIKQTSLHRSHAQRKLLAFLSRQGQQLSLMPYARLGMSLILFLVIIYSMLTGNHDNFPILILLQIAFSMVLLSAFLHYVGSRYYAPAVLMRFSLIVDSILLTELIYFTGGANNPLTVLYILPVINAALFCSPRFARILTTIIILCYLLLFFYYRPFSLFEHELAGHAHHDNSMLIHLIGMWVTFSFSALLAMMWISGLVQTVRSHEMRLQQAYQRQQEDEYWLVMGMQMAGLAHELSTPLNNLELIYEELQNMSDLPASAQADVSLIATQLAQCKNSLTRLKQIRPPKEQQVYLYEELKERLAHWRNLRPDVHYQWVRDPNGQKDYHVILHESFWYALFNILNNAADAGEKGIELQSVVTGDNEFHLTIYNHEGHLSEKQLAQAGLDIIDSDKPFGLGLGVRLAHASLSHLGGSLELSNQSKGGVRAYIRLPLQLVDSEEQ